MSGLNPFRPKKPEGEDPFPLLPTQPPSQTLTVAGQTTHQHQPSSLPSTSSSKPPDSIFLDNSSNTEARKDATNFLSPKAQAGTTPPSTSSSEPAFDNSAPLNDSSESDPFQQHSNLHEDDARWTELSSEASTTAPGDPHPREPIRMNAPPPVSSSRPLSSTGSTQGDHPESDSSTHVEHSGRPGARTAIPRSITSSQSSTTAEDTDSDDTDESKQSGRPVSFGSGTDARALASRAGNKERVPPPPPKSHHGKLINPAISPASRTTPSKATNRLSLQSSSERPRASPQTSQADSDYFGVSAKPVPPSDALQRSQSHYKRPPTPPLSRRHSQMRRSKSSLSKPSSSQLSAPTSMAEANSSAPSSPSSQKYPPSARSGESRIDSFIPDGTGPGLALRSENISPNTPSHQPFTTPGLENQSHSRTGSKRVSLINSMPPPPPPRRNRASNNSGNNKQHSRPRSEQRANEPTNFVPQPSNANDILADLSRLQKEVDDLRGHFEHQKPGNT